MSRYIFINWESLSNALEVEYEPDPITLRVQAVEAAERWIQKYEVSHPELSEEQRDTVVESFEKSILDHWSYANVFGNAIGMDRLLSLVNSWSKKGQVSEGAHEREILAGKAITKYNLKPDGIEFLVHEPFLIALVESMYQMSGGTPEEGLTLESMDPIEIPVAMRRIATMEDKEIGFDEERWDRAWRAPYVEVEQHA